MTFQTKTEMYPFRVYESQNCMIIVTIKLRINCLPFRFSTTDWKSSTAFSMAAISSGEAPPGGKNNSLHDRLYKNSDHYIIGLMERIKDAKV